MTAVLPDLLEITGMADARAGVIAAELDLRAAWERVYKKSGMPGVDGVAVNRFRRTADAALTGLESELASGKYGPMPLRLAEVQKKAAGSRRRLLVPTVVDRIAQTATAQWLGKKWNPLFDASSYAYRPGMGVRDALHRLGELRDQGFHWILDADLRTFFDSIDHPLLLAKLRRCLGKDSPMTAWIEAWIHATVWDGTALLAVPRGVPQGSPLSPILANFYLHELDVRMRAARIPLVRYADDFLLLARTPFELEEARALARQVLEGLQLELNEEKTKSVTFETCFRFLGAELQKDSILVPFEKKKAPKQPVYVAPVMPPALLRAFRCGELKPSGPLLPTDAPPADRPAPPVSVSKVSDLSPQPMRARGTLVGISRAVSLAKLRGERE